MRWSAKITACLVRAGPIRCSMRGTLCQLMFMPSPISGTRIWASRLMTRKSSATANATPPPIQKPSMAPIVICSISCQARVSRGPSFRGRRNEPRSMVLRERPSGALRSKPALNALVLPVSTTTEVPPSSSKLRAASVSWRSASGDSALMPSPRSKRTTAMRPSGPKPFSMVTKSAKSAPPCLPFLRSPILGGGLFLVGKKNLRNLIHPRIERRQLECFLQGRGGTRASAHGFIVLDARPLSVHRHLFAVDATVQACRDKAFVVPNILLSHTGQQLDQLILFFRRYCENVDQGERRTAFGNYGHFIFLMVWPNPTLMPATMDIDPDGFGEPEGCRHIAKAVSGGAPPLDIPIISSIFPI